MAFVAEKVTNEACPAVTLYDCGIRSLSLLWRGCTWSKSLQLRLNDRMQVCWMHWLMLRRTAWRSRSLELRGRGSRIGTLCGNWEELDIVLARKVSPCCGPYRSAAVACLLDHPATEVRRQIEDGFHRLRMLPFAEEPQVLTPINWVAWVR